MFFVMVQCQCAVRASWPDSSARCHRCYSSSEHRIELGHMISNRSRLPFAIGREKKVKELKLVAVDLTRRHQLLLPERFTYLARSISCAGGCVRHPA